MLYVGDYENTLFKCLSAEIFFLSKSMPKHSSLLMQGNKKKLNLIWPYHITFPSDRA